MTGIEEVSAEELAKLIHHYQHALAPDFDCEGTADSGPSWQSAPRNERKLMVAATRLALLDLAHPDPGERIALVGGEGEKSESGVDRRRNGNECGSVRQMSPVTATARAHRAVDDVQAYGREGRECGC
jgi:hypothetical protein